MENFMEFIKPELLVLVPVLCALGAGLKHAKVCKNNKIPLVLGLVGVVLAGIWVVATSVTGNWQNGMLAVFTAVVQGVLCAAAAVYGNQIIKQASKSE